MIRIHLNTWYKISCYKISSVWLVRCAKRMTFDLQSHTHSSLGCVVVAVELNRETLLTVRVTRRTLTLMLSHMVVIGAFWLVVYVRLVDQRNPASSIRDNELGRGLEFMAGVRKVRFFHSVVQRAVESSHHSALWIDQSGQGIKKKIVTSSSSHTWLKLLNVSRVSLQKMTFTLFLKKKEKKKFYVN